MIKTVSAEYLLEVRATAQKLALLSDQERKDILFKFAELIQSSSSKLLTANELDIQENKDLISGALLQRLTLTEDKIQHLAEGVRQVAELPDPIGKVTLEQTLKNNLQLKRITVPLGVIAIVFESRPDVIPQVLSLLLRCGNVAILKPGKEALHTAQAFFEITTKLEEQCAKLPKLWTTFLSSREAFRTVLNHPEAVDLVIPRGSNELVQSIMSETKIPVLGHADGVCHLYIDRSADLKKAVTLALNSKVQYPAACNALETLLVDKEIAQQFFGLFEKVAQEKNITLYGCQQSCKLLPKIRSHTGSWHVEYGSLELSLKVVTSLDEAIIHINTHGSHHTDAIVAEDSKTIEKFLAGVDSACVFANASTRFADGFRFGFGAEIGISTSKIHARGPVGLEGLVTYKYQLRGSGEIVE